MNIEPWPGSPSMVLKRELVAKIDRVADMLARTADAHAAAWPSFRCDGCDWAPDPTGSPSAQEDDFRVHVALVQADALARFGLIA